MSQLHSDREALYLRSALDTLCTHLVNPGLGGSPAVVMDMLRMPVRAAALACAGQSVGSI